MKRASRASTTSEGPPPLPIDIRILMVLGIVIAICYLFASATRGIWYDENWSIYLSQHDLTLGRTLRDRWLQEINPPLSFLLGWLVSPFAGDDLLPYRLANLAPAALLLSTFALTGRRCRPFATLFCILLFTNPWCVRYFAEFRSYFSQICCAGSVIAAAYYMFTSSQDLRRSDVSRLLAPAAGTVLVLNLHYIGAYLSAAMLMTLVLGLFLHRKPRFALGTLVTAMVGLVLMAATYIAQRAAIASETGVVHFWNNTSNLKAVAITTGFLVLSIGPNVAALWAAFLGGRKCLVSSCSGSVRAFVIWGALATCTMVLAALVLNLIRPVLLGRYLSVIIPTAIGPIASLAAVGSTETLISLIVCNAGALAIASSYKVAARENWSAGARFISRQVEDCHDTVVHTVPHWQLEPGPATVLPNEIRMNRFAYERLGRVFGFHPEPEGSRKISKICPTIIFAGHYFRFPPKPSFAAARIGLAIEPRVLELSQSFALGDGVVVVFPAASQISRRSH